MEEIGGYFEFELPLDRKNRITDEGIAVNSGSHAFRLLLQRLRARKVWLPDYTCEVMAQAAKAENVEVAFYPVGYNLEPSDLPDLSASDDILVINDYFGVKDSFVKEFINHLPEGVSRERIIADCAQALGCVLPPGVCGLKSPRKFAGLPDGGIAIFPGEANEDGLPEGRSRRRCGSLLTRLEEKASEGYAEFKAASASLHSEGITSMSPLTRRLLNSIDFERIADRRRNNYRILAEYLTPRNPLAEHIDPDPYMPMVYPLMTDDSSLRDRLIKNKIYVARYWPTFTPPLPPDSVATQLSERIIPLPIDQRYGAEEMYRILKVIEETL